jgi:phage terminase large subunit
MYFIEDCTLEQDQLMLDKHKPTSTVEEVPLYAYPDNTRGNKNQDENPVKIDDHGVDTTRYLCNELDGPEGKITFVELPNIFDRGA